jgi:RNA polymerase sigma-70 factor (ECF subfamily)
VLVHRYHARVFAFLLTLTRHRQDAEDLTQETFLRAWNKIHHYDPAMPLLPWLFTLARRLSIAALRRSRPLPEDWSYPADPEPPVQAAWLWEVARHRLSPEAYSALWLHYREELPLKEVAGVLGKREGAVKVLLHRARKNLAEAVSGRTRDADYLPQTQSSMP